MRIYSLLVSTAALVVLSAAVEENATGAELAVRKVRFVNQTAQDDVRVKCVGFANGLEFTLNVPKGQHRTQSGVQSGSRGYVVWEDFNETVIEVGKFELPANKNLIVTITGQAGNYSATSQETEDNLD